MHASSIASVVVVILIGTGVHADQSRPDNRPAIGSVVPFTVRDLQAINHSVSMVSGERIVVLAFLGVDCPLARLYTPRLRELARKYETKGVVFIGVDANRQDSLSAIASFAKDRQIAFPILKDLRQRIANQVGVQRTPEVVVLDGDRRIRYRGRIDDQFGVVPSNRAANYRKETAGRNELEKALGDLLAGKPVAEPETKAAGCLIGRDREPDLDSKTTYTKDVAPILNKNCVACHRPGQIGPFPLTTFDEAAGWADMIAEVTASHRMPPWHADPKYGQFANDARLTDVDRHALARWAMAGAPQGNPKDLPEPPTFPEKWSISTPDEVISLPEAFDVPATGVVDLQNFMVDPGWHEDRWVAGIEPRPGIQSIVHHILVFAIQPGESIPVLRPHDCFLAAYAPGYHPEALPLGYARKVKAGSQLIFNVHYTPDGLPHKDRSYVGFKFVDPRSVRREVLICGAMNTTLEIPAGAANYKIESQYEFKHDSLLLMMSPHMHYRGKDFLYEALYPDGRREILLSVPRYDFDWQTMYRLAGPKLMPQGTILHCVAHFDNSAENLSNPDPSTTVRFGWQSFEEMMIGFFEMAPAREGVVTENRWLAAMSLSYSIDQALFVLLTGVNVSIVGVVVFLFIRARSSRARQTANNR
jgi:peroxiredoxin/mono/diheme cytochrome c family protein